MRRRSFIASFYSIIVHMRFKLDDDNDGVANFLSLFSGNALATSRPQLIVQYYVP
jgi:hypothetical protein